MRAERAVLALLTSFQLESAWGGPRVCVGFTSPPATFKGREKRKEIPELGAEPRCCGEVLGAPLSCPVRGQRALSSVCLRGNQVTAGGAVAAFQGGAEDTAELCTHGLGDPPRGDGDPPPAGGAGAEAMVSPPAPTSC